MKSKTLREDRTAAERKSAAVATRRRRRILQAGFFSISDMIKIMKGNLARQLFLSHPELKQELWGGHLWNPSYCAVTVSDRSRDQVMAYIEGQKEKEKRK